MISLVLVTDTLFKTHHGLMNDLIVITIILIHLQTLGQVVVSTVEVHQAVGNARQSLRNMCYNYIITNNYVKPHHLKQI